MMLIEISVLCIFNTWSRPTVNKAFCQYGVHWQLRLDTSTYPIQFHFSLSFFLLLHIPPPEDHLLITFAFTTDVNIAIIFRCALFFILFKILHEKDPSLQRTFSDIFIIRTINYDSFYRIKNTKQCCVC